MKVREFIDLISKYGDHCLDDELVVKTSDRGFPATLVVPVNYVGPGFDWDSGKMIIQTSPAVMRKKK
jgi:hypothetical protein